MEQNYKPVIGLEVHIELGTKSKMFCECAAEHFSQDPNTHICPVCLGLPGALPYANQQAIDSTIMFGLAMNCKIASFSKFDRKHYFYPDLPKGYQISQYDMPLCQNGKFTIYNYSNRSYDRQFTIRIRRIHLEEDTGKLQHAKINGQEMSLIDYNRSGVPLMELVTEPDFESLEQVDKFLKEVQLIVRYLGISSADMEKGSMRLEANISLRPNTEHRSANTLPNYKVELKNINSFKFLQKAVSFELKRQAELLKNGEKVIQETRGFDEKSGETKSQRVKEEANDYRYFPEPDIPPIEISELMINNLQLAIPQLPQQRREKYRKWQLPDNYIEVLLADVDRSKYFGLAAALGEKHGITAKEIATVMVNQNLDKNYPESAGLVKKLLELSKKEYASQKQVEAACKKVIMANGEIVEKYQSGKTQVLGFLIGQVQKELRGSADPKTVSYVLTELLNK